MAQVFVSIGSNINRENNIRSGVQALSRRFGSLQLSSVYDSEAVGFQGDAFYNLVACFDTDDNIVTLLLCLRDIEDRHQRRRDRPRFSSRTLDIDLLLYDDRVQDDPECRLPRDEITHSAFVLAPLAEIAPQRCHPVVGQSYADLWRQFNQTSQALVRLDDFDWDLQLTNRAESDHRRQ